MNENIAEIPVKGARGKVEVVGTNGVFYSVRVGGDTIKRRRGAWTIPLRNGKSAELRASGFLPGFQRLFLDGEEVYRFGASTPLAAKILMFAPLLLILIAPTLGLVFGIILVFLNLFAIKNPALPPALRILLPVINTLAGAVLVYVIVSGALSQ